MTTDTELLAALTKAIQDPTSNFTTLDNWLTEDNEPDTTP